MNDISYEILDLFKKYGSDPEGIQKILENDSRPEVLYALSDVRKNLFDWMELKKCENVLQLDSGYGGSHRIVCRALRPCDCNGSQG